MKSTSWVIQTELRQNREVFVLFAVVAILMGIALRLASDSYTKISNLVIREDWDAEMVVLPKSMGLNDLQLELLTGESKQLLPEALFDTTVGMAQGQLRLGAVLPLKINGEAHVYQKGDPLGVSWLKGAGVKVEGWKPQSLYSTPEWSYQVMAAFFASGPTQSLQKLKELIDRKSVAQAFWLKEEIAKAESMRATLTKGLQMFTLSLAGLALVGMFLLVRWLSQRLSRSSVVLSELGYSNGIQRAMFLILLFGFLLLPLLLGWSI